MESVSDLEAGETEKFFRFGKKGRLDGGKKRSRCQHDTASPTGWRERELGASGASSPDNIAHLIAVRRPQPCCRRQHERAENQNPRAASLPLRRLGIDE